MHFSLQFLVKVVGSEIGDSSFRLDINAWPIEETNDFIDHPCAPGAKIRSQHPGKELTDEETTGTLR